MLHTIIGTICPSRSRLTTSTTLSMTLHHDHHLKMIHNYYSVLKIKKYKREVRGAAPHLALEEVLLRSREEQGGAEEIDEKLSKTKTNSETHFRPNNIIIVKLGVQTMSRSTPENYKV